MRMLGLLIGYVSTATMMSLAIGLAYLWKTDRLDDEKTFRIVALLHDVDVDKLAETEQPDEAVTPNEEPSLDDMQRYREVMARNFEVKQNALRRGRQEYDYSYERLKEENSRFTELAQDLEQQLEKEVQLSSEKAVSNVVRDLEMVKPETAKELLRRTLNESKDGMKDTILLINAMSTGKLKKLLQAFKTEEELDDLHRIHQTQLVGGPQQAMMSQALEELRGAGRP